MNDHPQGVTQAEIDQRVFDLYDEYCHGRIDRRTMLKRATALGFQRSHERLRLCWRGGVAGSRARRAITGRRSRAASQHQGQNNER